MLKQITTYLLIALFLLGCGTLEVGIEEEPTVEPTIEAPLPTVEPTTEATLPTVEPTTEAAAPTVEPATETIAEPPAVETGLQAYILSLQQEMTTQNYEALQARMTEPFITGYWRSEWVSQSREQAITQLKQYLPQGATITFSDENTDFRALLDGQPPEQMLGPDKNVVKLLHSAGWGENGQGESIIFITQNEAGQYQWESMLYAQGKFGTQSTDFPILPTDIKAVVVVADEATLYAGPGEEYGEVGSMFGGLPIPVDGISEDGKWYHSGCAEGADPTYCDYWVSSDPSVVQPLDEVPQQGGSQPGYSILPTDIKAVVVVADEATLYAGPGEEYGIVGGMFGGLPIPVDGISEDGKWYHSGCAEGADPTYCDYWVSSDPSVVQPLDEVPQHGGSGESNEQNASAILEQYGPILTYRDEEVGFALDYPASWHLADVAPEIKEAGNGYTLVFTSWVPDVAGSDGIPAGSTKMDLGITRSGANTLQEAVEQQKALLSSGETALLSTEALTLSGGLNAERWLLESKFGQFHSTITAINGHTIIVGGLGDETLIEQVIQTLRVIDVAS